MLTSPSTLSSSADLNFFGSQAVASSSSSVAVSTRAAPQQTTQTDLTRNHPDDPRNSVLSGPSTPLNLPITKKRRPFSSSAPPRGVKKLRTADPLQNRSLSSTPSRGSSRQRTFAPSPEPIYRSSRLHSMSEFHVARSPIPRHYWIEEDGTPGPRCLSSEEVVKSIMRSYKAHFRNPHDSKDSTYEPHPINYPFAELEYPNGCEKFILLAPKDKDHYNPIMCLEQSLYTIVECYLTPKQRSQIGTIPTELPSDVTPPPSSPSPSPPNSQKSDDSCTSSLTSLSLASCASASPRMNYLHVFQKAIHQRDGPLFRSTMDTINYLLRSLKYPALPSDPFKPSPPNVLREAVRSWTTSGIPKKVLMRIIEETYQRCVGPHVQTLRNYEAFSSEVYGELMPSFIADIVTATGLHQNSLLIDLGSGVGNVVVQATLQSGCTSYGIELMPTPAKFARKQLEQIKIRCRMWGIAFGNVELEEGDMLQSERLTQLIPKADVVLVNNKVFLESLNEALRPKFLDLKEGAMVISLKPFVSSINARVTERNVDDMSAIFDVVERPYHSGSVSWGSGSGSYYIHRVDREGYAQTKERFESMRAGSTRGSRSRR